MVNIVHERHKYSSAESKKTTIKLLRTSYIVDLSALVFIYLTVISSSTMWLKTWFGDYFRLLLALLTDYAKAMITSEGHPNLLMYFFQVISVHIRNKGLQKIWVTTICDDFAHYAIVDINIHDVWATINSLWINTQKVVFGTNHYLR